MQTTIKKGFPPDLTSDRKAFIDLLKHYTKLRTMLESVAKMKDHPSLEKRKMAGMAMEKLNKKQYKDKKDERQGQ